MTVTEGTGHITDIRDFDVNLFIHSPTSLEFYEMGGKGRPLEATPCVIKKDICPKFASLQAIF